MKEELPKVFGDGVLTMAISKDGMTLYAGTHEIRNVKTVRIESPSDSEAVKVELTFERGCGADSSIPIEESVRVAASIPWIAIGR